MFNRYAAVVEAMLALPPKQWHRIKLKEAQESTRLRAHLNRKRAKEIGVQFTFRTITEGDVTWLYWQHALLSTNGTGPKEVTGKKK